jgi:catechol 2,3-dioxygenase-like lactoylglutathione lyase family enzyme
MQTKEPDAAKTVGIQHIATVFVPVSDQNRALEFYVNKLGFEKRADFAYGTESRWLEVAPPGSKVAIALVPSTEGRSAGGDATHCALITDNIQSVHANMRARGVDVDEEIAGKGKRRAGLLSIDATITDPVPPQFFFRDSEGNRFLIVASG